jgi:hypothetical protein
MRFDLETKGSLMTRPHHQRGQREKTALSAYIRLGIPDFPGNLDGPRYHELKTRKISLIPLLRKALRVSDTMISVL